MTEDRRLQAALDTLHAGVRGLLATEAEFGADLSLALPDEAADVERAILMLARASRHARAMSDACTEMAKETAARADRLGKRADWMRRMILSAMDTLGRARIEAPDMTVSVRPGRPAVIITDEAALAAEYWRVTREPKKTAIREDIEQGVIVAGAELANGAPTVVIKGT
jgi:hypothetical protein